MKKTEKLFKEFLIVSANENVFTLEERQLLSILWKKYFAKEKQVVGIEVGNICPICKKGRVVSAGGCSTCDNCGAQLKCD